MPLRNPGRLSAAIGVYCLITGAPVDAAPPTPASPETVRWFQETEQALMDAAAPGDKAPWDRAMDASCVVTSEEGEVTDKQTLLAQLRPLPPGLTGGIRVKLYGGRDPKKLKAFVPLTPDAFVLSGGLGEWIFVTDPKGQATHLLDFRNFEPLVWTRVAETR